MNLNAFNFNVLQKNCRNYTFIVTWSQYFIILMKAFAVFP